MTTLTIANTTTAPSNPLFSCVTTCCTIYEEPVSDLIVTAGTGPVPVITRAIGFVRRTVTTGTKAVRTFVTRSRAFTIRLVHRLLEQSKRVASQSKQRFVTLCRNLPAHSQRLVRQWNALILLLSLLAARYGKPARPALRQGARIALVAAVLYLFASATLIASCLIVATLGVHGYDRMTEMLPGDFRLGRVPPLRPAPALEAGV